MKSSRKALACFPWAAILLLAADPAFADDTVLNRGREGPEPLNVAAGEESVVQMLSEELEFHFDCHKTRVVARFHFFNPAKPKLRLTIGFPDPGLSLGNGDGGDFGNPLDNMQTFIDGREVPSKVEISYINWKEGRSVWIPVTSGHHGIPMAWHTLDVAFPFRKEIVVERRFDSHDGNRNDGWYFFDYIVHTGSAWKGNIGKLTARVYLEDGTTVDNLRWEPYKDDLKDWLVMHPAKAEWKIISPTKLSLEWDDFKPTKDPDKRFITLVTRDKARDADEEKYRKEHPNEPP